MLACEKDIMQALYNTLILAISSALISTVIGTAADVGIDKWKKNLLRSSVMGVTNIPMMNPEIVTGVSMMLLFVFMGRLIGKQEILGY